ncbi:MAG: PEP-CTERM sorting domain-containing protein [Pseudomonadota bacterium]
MKKFPIRLFLSLAVTVAYLLSNGASAGIVSVNGFVFGGAGQSLFGVTSPDPFSFTFDFDSSTPDLSADPTRGFYAVDKVTLNLGSTTYMANSGTIEIRDFPGSDAFSMKTAMLLPAAAGSATAIELSLISNPGTAFSSDALPEGTVSLLDLFAFEVFTIRAVDANGIPLAGPFSIGGILQSVVYSNPVPVPATLFLFATGLFCIRLFRKP